MNKKTISLILALITIISLCSIPILGADDTTLQKPVYFYVSCWSIDSSDNENIVPLSETGEYATWQEVLAAINSYDVSGYKDYRFGIMYGIDIMSVYDISSDIVLPDNTYLILGNVRITKPISIKGGKNSLLVVTEWCEFADGASITNVVDAIDLYAQYEWNGTSQKWAKSQSSSPSNPFPTNIIPTTPQTTTTAPTTNSDSVKEPAKTYGEKTTDEDTAIEINGNIITTQKDNTPVKNTDGSYTLPGGGEIKTLNGVIIIAPAGTIVTADGKVSFPKGGSIKLTYGGHTFNINKEAVIVLDSTTPLGYSVIIDNPFGDIKKSDWFYDDVMYVYSHSLMNGIGVEEMFFSPNTPLTRGMIVTVLYRLAGSPNVSGLKNPFTDVAGNTWYTDAVKWAVENKIVNGYGDGKFGPNDNITRQDMAVILMRYMSFIKYEYVVTEEYRLFADEDEIDDYAKNAVQVLNKLGIINGKGDNVIDPQGMTTRAEVAAMLHRLLEKLNKQ